MKVHVISFCVYFANLPLVLANDFQGQNYLGSQQKNNTHYSGFDARGHFYRGNKSTGFYYNYGTGETCFGKFQQRKCYNKSKTTSRI